MEWMFLVFTVGALAYGVVILREYKEGRVRAHAKLDVIVAEEGELEAAIKEHEEKALAVVQQVEEIKKAVAELQSEADKRGLAVKRQKEEKEQRGKFRV